MAKVNSQYVQNLINLSKIGRQNSFLELCEMNYQVVYALAVFIFVDEEVAFRMTKRVFVAAWENILDVRDDIDFRTWIQGLAVYTFMEEYRAIQNKMKEEKYPQSNLGNGHFLLKKLSSVPIENRIMFVLHELKKYTFEEIADIFGGIRAAEVIEKIRDIRYVLIGKSGLKDNMLDDYLDSRLDEKEKADFEIRLSQSEELKEQINNRIELLQELEYIFNGINPPDNLLNQIQQELLTPEEIEKRKKERIKKLHGEISSGEDSKKNKIKKGKNKKRKEKIAVVKKDENFLKRNFAFLFLLFLIIISSGSFAYLKFFGINDEIEFYNPNGVVLQNGAKKLTKLLEGDIILTGENSSVKLKFPNSNELVLDENTGIMLKKKIDNNYYIRFDEGRLELFSKSESKGEHIEIGGVEIINLSSNLIIERENKNIRIRVSSGFAQIKGVENITLVNNYYCSADIYGNLKIPLNTNADPKFAAAVMKVSDKNLYPLSEIKKRFKPSDALTIFYMIKYGGSAYRKYLVEMLSESFPLPEGVKSANIINLDEHSLSLWRSEIEWQI